MSDDKGEWNPGRKYQVILSQIQDVLESGEERTVRDVYYALEARGNKWEYRFVKRAVKKGRRAGYIDPAQIIDSSRQPITVPSEGYDHPRQFLDDRVRSIWEEYHEDLWRYQDVHVEVWLEKQSLATVFDPICRRHGVRLEATRGDWSDSKVYEAGQRLRERIFDGKDVKVLYYGDFNPSGYHAPVSILDTLEYYGLPFDREFPTSDDPRYYDPEWHLPIDYQSEDEDIGSFDLERCGLNLEHVEQFQLPENPVPSSSDKDVTIKKWFRQFVSDGRDTNIELNALKEFERSYLEDLIESKIRQHVDDDRWEQAQQRVQNARDALSETITIDDSHLDDAFDPTI